MSIRQFINRTPRLGMLVVTVLLGVTTLGALAPGGTVAAEFDITRYGATPNDARDDTLAIRAALAACRDAGGGTVIVPKGTFLVARQGSESPILEIPSKTTFRGEGVTSTLKFTDGVNRSNFWRMLGASLDCHDITIHDLHLDGSTTSTGYEKGKTAEQNHGMFFYRKKGRIENVTIRDCFIENFSGDGIAFSQGCRKFVVRDITLKNFIRQGIQVGGGEGDGGHLVTLCHDLEHTVKPGGTTIHVEHAEGASDIRIVKNRCRQSLLVGGGADKLTVLDNEVTGRIEGNSIKNGLFENNVLKAGEGKRALMQFGYASGLTLRGNRIEGAKSDAVGIYVWGKSRYNAAPSTNVLIEKNVIELSGQPISFNGVEGAKVRDNTFKGTTAATPVLLQRCKDVAVEVAADAMR